MRSLNPRFKRLLKLRDLEFFKVVLSDDERDAYLLIYDERHSQIESEDGNSIKIFLISNFKLSESSYQDVLSFNDDLSGMKYKCSYFMDSVFVQEEFNFSFDMLAIRNYVEKILKSLSIDKEIPDIKKKILITYLKKVKWVNRCNILVLYDLLEVRSCKNGE